MEIPMGFAEDTTYRWEHEDVFLGEGMLVLEKSEDLDADGNKIVYMLKGRGEKITNCEALRIGINEINGLVAKLNSIDTNANRIEDESKQRDQTLQGNIDTEKSRAEMAENNNKANIKINADEIANHEAATAVHGATDAATPERIVMRDTAGRAKFNEPLADSDAAVKKTVDDAETRAKAYADDVAHAVHDGSFIAEIDSEDDLPAAPSPEPKAGDYYLIKNLNKTNPGHRGNARWDTHESPHKWIISTVSTELDAAQFEATGPNGAYQLKNYDAIGTAVQGAQLGVPSTGSTPDKKGVATLDENGKLDRTQYPDADEAGFGQQIFTGDGTKTVYNLDSRRIIDTPLVVFVDGIAQRAGMHYTVDETTNTLTFVTAPANGSNILFYYSDVPPFAQIFVTVPQLPATGQINRIYLVPDGQNSFDMSIWYQGQYIPVGKAFLNLQNYYTGAEVDQHIAAAEARLIPLTQKGAAAGVATLDLNVKVPEAQIPDLPYIPSSEKGAANGVATLDANKKVIASELPSLDFVPNADKDQPNGFPGLDANSKIDENKIPDLSTRYINRNQIDAANGVLGLDSNGKVPNAKLNDLSGIYLLKSKVGDANGAAPLDANSKVPEANIPDLGYIPYIAGVLETVGVYTDRTAAEAATNSNPTELCIFPE
jgi:hypothetical protein